MDPFYIRGRLPSFCGFGRFGFRVRGFVLAGFRIQESGRVPVAGDSVVESVKVSFSACVCVCVSDSLSVSLSGFRV